MAYTCDTCSYHTDRRSLFLRHKRAHAQPKYVCTECVTMCTTSTKYAQHCAAAHGNKLPFKCQKCSKSYASLSGLATHTTHVHSPHRYICTECDFTASVRSRITQHVSRKHITQEHKCLECSYIAQTKQNLQRHQLIHREPTYACDMCDYKAKQPQGLLQHRLFHFKPVPTGTTPRVERFLWCLLVIVGKGNELLGCGSQHLRQLDRWHAVVYRQ